MQHIAFMIALPTKPALVASSAPPRTSLCQLSPRWSTAAEGTSSSSTSCHCTHSGSLRYQLFAPCKSRQQQQQMGPTAAVAAVDCLPTSLLVEILEYVEQKELLSSCSLVSQAWHAAALAATSRCTLTFSSSDYEADELPRAAASFQAWLQRHGSSLRSLQVEGPPMASMQPIYTTLRSLPQLQDLLLSGLSGLQIAAMVQLPPDLPNSLTQLILENDDDYNAARLPRLSLHLPGLQVLHVFGVCFDPHSLRGLTRLQDLLLHVYNTDTQAGLLGDDGAAAGAAVDPLETLLAGVQSLTQLAQLWVEIEWNNWEGDAPAVPPNAWAGLTASSKLQYLHVGLTFPDVEALPGSNMLQHMFPGPERQLPQLETLELGCGRGIWRHNWCVPARDLGRIAASCPRLADLELHRLLDPATVPDLTSLLALTSCTRLALGGDAVDSAVAPIVAQLTQLRCLGWSCAEDGELDANALAQLTALTQLKWLLCSSDDFDSLFEDSFDPEFMDGLALERELGLPDIKNRQLRELLTLTSSEEEGPVWLQILRLLKVPGSVVELMQQCHQQQLQLPAFNYQAYQQLRSDSERLQSLRAQAAGLEGQALPPSAEAAMQPAEYAETQAGGSNPDSPAATSSEALQVLQSQIAELERQVMQDAGRAFSHAPQAALAGLAACSCAP